jgi:hypothetical protein
MLNDLVLTVKRDNNNTPATYKDQERRVLWFWDHPTRKPSPKPSALPTFFPSYPQTLPPSFLPTVEPTFIPSQEPSISPSFDPTFAPSFGPPSMEPSSSSTSYFPSSSPSYSPTLQGFTASERGTLSSLVIIMGSFVVIFFLIYGYCKIAYQKGRGNETISYLRQLLRTRSNSFIAESDSFNRLYPNPSYEAIDQVNNNLEEGGEADEYERLTSNYGSYYQVSQNALQMNDMSTTKYLSSSPNQQKRNVEMSYITDMTGRSAYPFSSSSGSSSSTVAQRNSPLKQTTWKDYDTLQSQYPLNTSQPNPSSTIMEKTKSMTTNDYEVIPEDVISPIPDTEEAKI